MKANMFRRYAVDPALGLGDPTEDGKATLLHPFIKGAFLEQGNDLGMIPAMDMSMIVGVLMVMPVFLMMSMIMVVLVMMIADIHSLVPVMPLDQETPTGNTASLSPMKAACRQFHRQGR